eukprot:Sdes_comp20975_c0_seq12m19091
MSYKNRAIQGGLRKKKYSLKDVAEFANYTKSGFQESMPVEEAKMLIAKYAASFCEKKIPQSYKQKIPRSKSFHSSSTCSSSPTAELRASALVEPLSESSLLKESPSKQEYAENETAQYDEHSEIETDSKYSAFEKGRGLMHGYRDAMGEFHPDPGFSPLTKLGLSQPGPADYFPHTGIGQIVRILL